MLLHGVGSKKDLLEKFRATELSAEPVLVIDGFDPACDIAAVLRDFCKEIGKHESLPKDIAEVLLIFQAFVEDSTDLHTLILSCPAVFGHFMDPPGNHPRGTIFPTVD